MSETANAPQGVVPSINLPKRLEIAREHAQLTQADLGDMIGMDRTAIGKCEQGRRRVSKADVIAWALATGVRFDWLAGDDFPTSKAKGEGGGSNPIWYTVEPAAA